MLHAGRVDANQAAIVKALRQVGATVQSLADVGGGVPDLLVGYRYRNFLLEVKDGNKPPSRQKLRETQKRWHALWKGDVSVVTTANEALEVLGFDVDEEDGT